MSSVKISEFTTGAISLTSKITFIDNNTNFIAPTSDLVTLLGTTGSLTSVGESLAIPVLTVPTTGDNQIRKMLSGPGIIFSLGAQNAIRATWNITQDGTGEALIDNVSAVKPTVSSLVGGSGITLTKVGDVITISLT
jgi:hypothetical protein